MIRSYGHCEKIGSCVVPCTDRAVKGKDFELILTVKWKLDILQGDHLVVNFWRSVIIAEL